MYRQHKSMEKDRIIDSFLNNKYKVGNIEIQCVDILFFICVSLFAYLLRINLFPIVSGDYAGFLDAWFNDIDNFGGFKSLQYNISNYTSPYMYLMCLVANRFNRMYALKNISVLFDYSSAVALMFIIYRMTGNKVKALIGYSVLLLCPTVFIDSAWWCQCDIIYISFILWALYFFLKEKSVTGFVFIGIAFSFKLQTLFIIPFLIIMYLKKKNINIIYIVLVPIVYVIMHIPALIAGRPFMEVLKIYFEQSGYYPWGTLNYPNFYIFLDETMQNMRYADELSGAGTILTIVVLGVLAYYLYISKFETDSNMFVTIALFSVAITVYTLPHMHERYGLLIDIVGIIYGILRPKKLWCTCGFVLVSLLSYMPFLVGVNVVGWPTLATLQLALIISVGYDLHSQIKRGTNRPSVEA